MEIMDGVALQRFDGILSPYHSKIRLLCFKFAKIRLQRAELSATAVPLCSSSVFVCLQ
jgi:hypothetical protein